jgi:hypothetical protein
MTGKRATSGLKPPKGGAFWWLSLCAILFSIFIGPDEF